MKITIVSDLLAEEHDGQPVDADFVSEYLDRAGEHIVPGVLQWRNPTVVHAPGTLTVTADLLVTDVVEHGEWKGETITEEWIRDYIVGADAYWLAPGVAQATSVTFG